MRALIVLFALGVSSVAVADPAVGVVVTGDYLTTPINDATQTWLRQHGRTPVAKPMPEEAVKTLYDCFVIDDTKCSRAVIEKRSTTESVVAMRVEVTNKKTREIQLTAYWLMKGHNGVQVRRTCEECTEPVLRTTIDAMMLDVAKLSPGFMGRISITSTPPGLTVLLDNAAVGVTPLERDVPTGPHKLALSQDGRTGREKAVDISAGMTAEINLAPPPPPAAAEPVAVGSAAPVVIEKPSRAVPGVMIGIGLAGVGVGAALYFTSEKMTGAKPTYRDTKNLGIGVAAGGAVVTIVGALLMMRGGEQHSAPTVSVAPGGATVGWAGSF